MVSARWFRGHDPLPVKWVRGESGGLDMAAAGKDPQS